METEYCTPESKRFAFEINRLDRSRILRLGEIPQLPCLWGSQSWLMPRTFCNGINAFRERPKGACRGTAWSHFQKTSVALGVCRRRYREAKSRVVPLRARLILVYVK